MKLDLVVINNAVTDVVYEIPQEILYDLKSCKNSTELEEKLKNEKPIFQSPAGSPGNVGFSGAALGLDVGIQGTLGQDKYADEYAKKVIDYGMIHLLKRIPGNSGVCYTFITPDKERHFNAFLNNSTQFDLSNRYHTPKIVHTSAYEILSAPQDITNYVTELKSKGTKVSLDLADAKLCSRIQKDLKKVLSITDILFSSPEEFRAVYEKEPSRYNYEHEVLCLKFGVGGSSIISKENSWRIAIYPANVVNTNGAGDNYAAGFLYGFIKELPLDLCGRLGSAVAAKACSQIGACLEK